MIFMNMNINEKKIKKSNKEIDLSGFQMQDKLNPKIWDGEQNMRSDVRKTLLQIADDYIESLEIPGLDIEDVTMTGSLSNYNWSKYSDVDLHIVIDYKDLDMEDDLSVDFLKTKGTLWNNQHDIKIYGFDVELYVQDSSEEHVSTGVYSILNNEWNIKPEKKKITINDDSVKRKANRIMDMIEDLYNDLESKLDYEDIEKRSNKIKDKIKRMRQSGLETGGEFSVENMVFKVLRRNGMIERLSDIKIVSYDKSVTLESNITESIEETDDFELFINSEFNPIDSIQLRDILLKSGSKTIPFRYVSGDLDLYGTNISDLGQLKHVGGYLYLQETNISDLGQLKHVGGYLDLQGTKVSDLGQLEHVGGSLYLQETNISDLGQLKHVGGGLDLDETNISDLGQLEHVGGGLYLRGTPISKKYSEQEIRKMVNVVGRVYL